MADPVQDAFGPVLRRIQEHLVRLEQKFDAHAVRIEERMSDVEKAASGLVFRNRYVLGATNEMDMKLEAFEREMQQLRARVTALEPHDA